MIASRITQHVNDRAPNTACPPRRSFVAGDARRRGQACDVLVQTLTAFCAGFSFIVAG
jgi:hypothetical protein